MGGGMRRIERLFYVLCGLGRRKVKMHFYQIDSGQTIFHFCLIDCFWIDDLQLIAATQICPNDGRQKLDTRRPDKLFEMLWGSE